MGARAALVPQRLVVARGVRGVAPEGRRGCLGVPEGAFPASQRPTCVERRDFGACDEDNKGYLSRENFKVAVVMFSCKPSKVYIVFIYVLNIQLIRISQANIIVLSTLKKDFLDIIFLLSIFEFKDRGFLTFKDFKKAFNSASPQLSEKIIVEAFKEVDQDSDGCISFKEFESAMKYGQDEVSPVCFA
ncbi:EF-hand calcium-binding domain-containing protein 11 [Patagioenas fasciata]|uniref:EF-hand calcium-binding domain-containing protein 11 n=1 Tax=Patagioenas fasciata TaxID=372321 RepID=UPI003A99B24B